MITIYRTLLHLYPSAFRRDFGDELVAIFRERLAGAAGFTARLALFASAAADVVINAIAAHADILGQDLHFAVRGLRSARGFAFTAIAVVALGVGANTAAFSLADFVLLRPLPYPSADRIVKLWQSSAQGDTNEVSPANYRDWRAMATGSFRGMEALTLRSLNLVGEGPPQHLDVALVTPGLMPLIGVSAAHGRIITNADTQAGAATAVISESLWRGRFHADPAILGRAIRLDSRPYTIIGVMPASYYFPNRDIAVWVPLILSGSDFDDRSDTYLNVIARLAPHATTSSARAEMDIISARLAKQYADNREVIASVRLLRDHISRKSRLLLIALCGASACILLLACANLASLLLARGVSRTRELAVRNALGAGRDRLVRQLITESIVLAFIGGIFGLGAAAAGVPLLARLVPNALPIAEVPSIDVRVLVFALAVIVITGLAFGVAPALRAASTEAVEALRERGGGGNRKRQRAQSALVVVEITATIVLVASTGLLMRAIWRVEAIEPGFRTAGVTTMRTELPLPKYGPTAVRERFYARVLDAVRALPGIDSAAYTTGVPMVRTGGIWHAKVPGSTLVSQEANAASLRYVTPGYFATLGIPLLGGRDIASSDTRDKPYVAVVSESFGQRYWPGQSPIGRRFNFAMSDRIVVGVVGEVRVRGRELTSEPQVYVPSGQVGDNDIIGYIPKDLVIHASLPADRWMPSVRRIVAEADPELPISDIKPLAEISSDDTAPRRVQLRLLAALSAIALLISAVGIHGLLSFGVSQRTRELGIRRALGAQAAGIVRMVVREGLALTLIGAVLGTIVGLLVARSMSSLLFGVAPGDPATFTGAILLCVFAAAAGCLTPAIRAALVDPMVALREG